MATNPTTTLPKLNIGSQPTLNMSGTPDYTSFFSPETISEQQYLTGGVDFYTQTLGTGIQSTVTDEDKSEEETKEDTGPDIFKPIGGDGGPADVGRTALENALKGGLDNVTLYNEGQLNPKAITNFDQMGNAITGDYSKSFEVDPKTGKTTLKAKGDLVSDFFSNFTSNLQASSIEQTKRGFTASSMGDPITAVGPTGKKRAVGVPPVLSLGLSVAGLGLFSGLAAVGGAANMAIQQQNAARIKAVGGGAFMDVNNMMVSRAPGSFIYSGNLMGMSQEQMRNVEAIRRGYVPGTLQVETFNPVTGKYGSATGVRDVIEAKDFANTKGGFTETGAWRDLAGNTSYGTDAEQTAAYTDAVNAKKGLTGNYKVSKSQIMNAINSVQTSWSLTKGTHVTPGTPTAIDLINDLTRSAQQKQQEDEMNAADRALGRMSGRGEEDQTFAEARAEKEAIDKMAETGKVPADVKAEIDRAMKEQTGGDGGSSSGFGAGQDTRGDASDTGKGSGGSSSSDDASDDGSGGTAFKSGGRVGYQEGGFAERPEFVGGNQTQPDKVSVADDQPRDVQEGSFVINAAAADFAGRDDIEKMVRNAYKKVGDTGQSGVSQEVQIAVSKGEVIIPPHIAKIIGYDRLNKINNRGKKEIARRQKAAGGGFIDRKKFAKGDMVLPKSKPKKVNQSALGDVELRADMEEFIQTDPLARLGWNLYEKGDLDIKAIVLPANRKVSVGVGGVYTPKGERRDPGPTSRKFEGFAEQQGVTKQNRNVAGVHYFAGENVNYGRYDATITLLHELRHHAMRHISNKYKTALPELSREESLFDAQDYANRLQARKVKPSIPKEMKEKDAEVRQRHMYMSPSANKQIAAYQSVAEEVLKDRKVPPRTKSKEVEGFFTRAMGLLGL